MTREGQPDHSELPSPDQPTPTEPIESDRSGGVRQRIVHVQRGPLGAGLRVPWQAAEVIRGAPTRAYDGKTKLWWVPVSDLPLVTEMFRDAGYRLDGGSDA